MRKIRIIAGWFSVTFLFLTIAYSIAFNFMNPKMTQTEVFLEIWFTVPIVLIFAVVCKWAWRNTKYEW